MTKLNGFSIVDASGNTVAYIISKATLDSIASSMTTRKRRKARQQKKSPEQIKREKTNAYHRAYYARKKAEAAAQKATKRRKLRTPKRITVRVSKLNTPIAASGQ